MNLSKHDRQFFKMACKSDSLKTEISPADHSFLKAIKLFDYSKIFNTNDAHNMRLGT